MRQEAFEDVNRGGELVVDGAVFRLAVPPAIFKLLAEQPSDQAIRILVKAGTQGGGPPIDAWLDFAAEERLPGVLPPAMVPDQPYRAADPVGPRVDAEIMQQLKCWQRGDPGLAPALVPLVESPRPEARVSGPLALGDRPCALRRDDPGWCMERSRNTCQPMAGSESSSQSITVMRRSLT
jgi:hypothetical protein